MRAALVIALALVSSVAHAVTPHWVSTNVNAKTGTVTFSIMFDDVPNFTTVDAFGRQADSFQFYVDSQRKSLLGDFYKAARGEADPIGKSIIRGESIHAGSGIPIVWVDPAGGPPESGGWGATHTTVPFSLHGKMLKLEVSIPDLEDDDGVFWYYFETFEYGGTSCSANSRPLFSDKRHFKAEICLSNIGASVTP
jgi:hypothetical protein